MASPKQGHSQEKESTVECEAHFENQIEHTVTVNSVSWDHTHRGLTNRHLQFIGRPHSLHDFSVIFANDERSDRGDNRTAASLPRFCPVYEAFLIKN